MITPDFFHERRAEMTDIIEDIGMVLCSFREGGGFAEANNAAAFENAAQCAIEASDQIAQIQNKLRIIALECERLADPTPA